MSRTMGSAALAAVAAPQTSEVFLFLLDIVLDGVLETLHFVNNTQPITRLGVTYTPLAFRVTLPNEGETIHEAQLVMDAVDLVVIEKLRQANEKPQVTFSLILASAPDADSEAGPFTFEVSNVSYNAKSLSCTLNYGKKLEAKFPKVGKTPYNFPGLF